MMGRSVAELMLFRYTQIIHHARKFVNKRLEAICFHLTRLWNWTESRIILKLGLEIAGGGRRSRTSLNLYSPKMNSGYKLFWFSLFSRTGVLWVPVCLMAFCFFWKDWCLIFSWKSVPALKKEKVDLAAALSVTLLYRCARQQIVA